MTKLEELKAAFDDAYAAANAADDAAYAAYSAAAYDAAYAAYSAAYAYADAAWIDYMEELEKQNDKT